MTGVEQRLAAMVGLTIENVAVTPNNLSADDEFIELDVYFADGSLCNLSVTTNEGVAVEWQTP